MRTNRHIQRHVLAVITTVISKMITATVLSQMYEPRGNNKKNKKEHLEQNVWARERRWEHGRQTDDNRSREWPQYNEEQ